MGAPVHGNPHVGAVTNGTAHVDAQTKLDAAIVRTQARAALVRLGWKPAISQGMCEDSSELTSTRWSLTKVVERSQGCELLQWQACQARLV